MKTPISEEKVKNLVRIKNLLIGAVIFLVVIIFFVLLNIFNENRINYGLKVARVNIGAMSAENAKIAIGSAAKDFAQKTFSLNYKNEKWQATPEKMGIQIDVEQTISSASLFGHNKNIFVNSWQQLESLFSYNLAPAWQIDNLKMNDFFKTNLGSIYMPAQNATLVYSAEKDDFTTTSEQNGTTIDTEKIIKTMQNNIVNPQTDILLALVNDTPEVMQNETQDAYKQIKNIMQALPLLVVINEENENATSSEKEIDKIDKEKLLELIVFEPVNDPQNPKNKILGISINQEKAKDYLVSLAPLINQEPIDAKLTFKDNRVSVFALSHDGIRLEIEENIPILFKAITEGQKANLQITTTKPSITTESIDNLGITALLGKGTSNYTGSPANRTHNIKIGAARFNGILVKPGEEFSFNTILGDVGPEQGYEPELVIKQNATVPEYGGGLCQVSTTVFRAAVYAGMQITQRYPHAFPVKYYNPQGFDATIYPPSPDLKFINNTPGYILLQSKIVGSEITFEIYGTDDGRTVKVDGPQQYDIKDDGSTKAVLTQEVYSKDGNLMCKKSFYSVYKSPNLYPVRNPLE